MRNSTEIVMDNMKFLKGGSRGGRYAMGDIYIMVAGEPQLLKKGQRLARKGWGHIYWQAGTMDIPVSIHGKNQYIFTPEQPLMKPSH